MKLRLLLPLRSLRLGSIALASVSLVLAACNRHTQAAEVQPQPAKTSVTPAVVPAIPVYGYTVVNAWPHDRNAFTQGLIYLKGILLETTGLKGHSSLRKVDLETGNVRQLVKIPSEYFGEGMTVLNGKIYVLTWQNQLGFVYDLQSLYLEKEFSYTGEGWGLTTDGQWLILSDGTDSLRFIDPSNFSVKRTVQVTEQGQPLRMLNELEYIKGEIYANIWQTNTIVRIDPVTGQVLGRIDFTGLLAPQEIATNTDVLNGIAYDAPGDRLFVTGKNWPRLFEVQLKQK